MRQRFIYAGGRTPIAMEQGEDTYYLAYDQVGSLRVVIDQTGTIVKEIQYDTYGNIVLDTNQAFKVPIGFACGLYDPDTNLTRFGFRDYDPELGRWTAKDPIGFVAGDPNLYAYTFNNPVNLVDPDGRAVPLLAVAWGVVEVGLSVLDAYAMVETLMDECASVGEKSLSVSLFVAGLWSIGGGAGFLARQTIGELPVLFVSRSQLPHIAESIWHAQRAGHPNVLTYGGRGHRLLTHESAMQGARRISDTSIDVYPFANAVESGAESGVWVGHVPIQENRLQGSIINQFIRRNGLQAGDKYRVVVIP